MKRKSAAIWMAAVMTAVIMAVIVTAGCGYAPKGGETPRESVTETETHRTVIQAVGGTAAPEQETSQRQEEASEQETTQRQEEAPEQETTQRQEAAPEQETTQRPETAPEQETTQRQEEAPEQEMSQRQEEAPEQETTQRPEAASEQAAAEEQEAVQEAVTVPAHVCSGTGGNIITVLAFGQQEPNCFYGAKYDVKCGDCGQYLDVVYREPLGHLEDEGEVTCQPDCTGGGSIQYTCVRCGAEWSAEYGQIQPHAWIEGAKKVTDWENGGTKQVPYLYCSVCGKREESE